MKFCPVIFLIYLCEIISIIRIMLSENGFNFRSLFLKCQNMLQYTIHVTDINYRHWSSKSFHFISILTCPSLAVLWSTLTNILLTDRHKIGIKTLCDMYNLQQMAQKDIYYHNVKIMNIRLDVLFTISL